MGKSTLTSRLIQHLRAAGRRVGVVAVDPTSPFSGGAILGDRIRMQAHWADPEVFVRSLATRGAVGGLSRSAADVARVLGAWGAHVVLIETVGVGQDELEVMHVAHSTLVVQAPGAGDDLQAAKAGLMECADVFAVNKADLAGADAAIQHLRAMLALGLSLAREARVLPVSGHAFPAAVAPRHPGHAAAFAHAPPFPAEGSEAWAVPVLSCVAAQDRGVAEVLAELERHAHWLNDSALGRERRAQRLRQELTALIRDALSVALFERHREEIERAAQRVAADEADPYSASRALVSNWLPDAAR